MSMGSLVIAHQEHMKNDAKNRVEEEKSYRVTFGDGRNSVSAQCKPTVFSSHSKAIYCNIVKKLEIHPDAEEEARSVVHREGRW